MKQLWRHFENKTFEEKSKDTNNSVPKTKSEQSAKLIEETVALNKAIEELLGDQIVLPVAPDNVEIAVQVEEPQQQGEKSEPNIRRKNSSKDRVNQKPKKKPKRK